MTSVIENCNWKPFSSSDRSLPYNRLLYVCYLFFQAFIHIFQLSMCALDRADRSAHFYNIIFINPLPDDKILGFPKLKVFSDDKLNVTQTLWEKKKMLVTSIFFFS